MAKKKADQKKAEEEMKAVENMAKEDLSELQETDALKVPVALAAKDAVIEDVTSPPPPVTITLDEARQLYELCRIVEYSSAHYKLCQAVNFRMSVEGVFNAGKLQAAYTALKAAIDVAEPDSEA